jgi:hypothetical protein
LDELGFDGFDKLKLSKRRRAEMEISRFDMFFGRVIVWVCKLLKVHASRMLRIGLSAVSLHRRSRLRHFARFSADATMFIRAGSRIGRRENLVMRPLVPMNGCGVSAKNRELNAPTVQTAASFK